MIEETIAKKKYEEESSHGFMAGFGGIGPLITRNLPNERSREK